MGTFYSKSDYSGYNTVVTKTIVIVNIWCQWYIPAGDVRTEDLENLLADGKVKLVALTAASNAFGLRTDISNAAATAHTHGAELIIDAVHGAPHNLPDVTQYDVDYLLFSPYKICMIQKK